MAKAKTMQRGYRDVGYLLAARLPEFRPAQYTVTKWRQLIARLDKCLETQNTAAVQAWFKKHYSALMHIIPERRHREFVSGVIERAEEDLIAQPTGGPLKLGECDAQERRH